MSELTLAERWKSWAPYLLSVLRIVMAFLFFQYGSAKVLAFPGAIVPGGGTVPLTSIWGIGGSVEMVGGLLLLVGWFTRPVAFVVAGEMAVAYFIGHAKNGFWPLLNGGVPAVVFCFLWLYVSAAGPGPWSIDALRSRPGQVNP
ncbi:MAG: DoxX family protein [Gemmatimonadota bacterium]